MPLPTADLKTTGARTTTRAAVAQSVERVLGKDEVKGSNPLSSFLLAGGKTERDG